MAETIAALQAQGGAYTLETITPQDERSYTRIESIQRVIGYQDDLAPLIADLSVEDLARLFRVSSRDVAATTFTYLAVEAQKKLLHVLTQEQAAALDLCPAAPTWTDDAATRVAEVRDLATWLLEDNPGWSRKELDAKIATNQRMDVKLAHKVPVAWVYFTGWSTRDGTIHFRDDVYGHDEPPARSVVASLAKPAPPVQTAARASGFVVQSADSRPVMLGLKQVSFLDSQ